MTSTATVTLPAGHTVYMQGATNASYQQKATVTIPGQSPMVFTGQGEGNKSFINQNFTTPADGSGSVSVTVEIQNSSNGWRSWNPSSVSQGQYSLMGFNAQYIVSEDGVDHDYNDCALSFVWWMLS